ncbi:conserved hypothetical protein [Ixodes scapularis]|uniref:DUF1308 domain-containing protein n=1 Tax=Ixodes scapularis TaxID=6945 RepID=B7PCM2_IXOSC|nr:conserved hypothetical protein [Ixodes scapularis]|eukprot:XP_002409969.1 conserved hypothetical protein [Ixodes scapularis]
MDVNVARQKVLEKIEGAEKLLKQCDGLSVCPGKSKLQRKIQAEIKFLRKLCKAPDSIKGEHLRCTNLAYLSSVVTCSLAVHGLVDVLKPFSCPEVRGPERTIVDVVASNGLAWIKVVARNPEALLTSSLGDGEYGRRTILDQVRDMVDCAGCHPHLYRIPEVKIWTALPVGEPLREIIEGVGHEIVADLESGKAFLSNNSAASLEDLSASDDSADNGELTLTDDSQESFSTLKLGEVPEDAVLNLDVSTMIAYASALTNGRCHFRFRENVLTEQAENERKNPVKPALDELLGLSNIGLSESAYDDFVTIVRVMAGPCETAAAQRLLSHVAVVPDKPSVRAVSLSLRGKIRKRSKIIFGTGDQLKAVTVTANSGFLRAAKAQGVDFVAYVHESRALTEAKEATATPL